MGVEERNYGGCDESISPSTSTGTGSGTGTGRVKFYCSHGGKILLRPYDGTLKYIGGETRAIAVPRSISFSELMNKMSDLFDGEYVLKYQIAKEDLDSLVSVKSDEDICHMFDEYDRLERSGTSKLRTFLFPVKPAVLESHIPLSGLGPHSTDQRFIDAINGIVRPTNFSPKPLLNTGRIKSFSPSPTDGSPQPLSPRSTVTHNSSMITENSLISGLQSRLTRVHKVQSSPNLCSLNIRQSNCHRLHCSPVPHQHYYHGFQSPGMTPDHQGYQFPNNSQDYVQPPSQPVIGRSSEYSRVPLGGQAGHHNASHYYAMSRGYPGSGGRRRWAHLDQYFTPCGSLPRSPSDPWDF